MNKHIKLDVDKGRECLDRLRDVGRYCGEMAKKEALDHKVRAAYFDAESRLMTALGELDYILNLPQFVSR